MAPKFSNEAVLEQLKHGSAHFELVSSPVLSISTSSYSQANPVLFLGDHSHRFFAKTGPPLRKGPPAAIRKPEFYKVRHFPAGLFVAVAEGMAANNGHTLTPDNLRRAVKDCICSEYPILTPQYEAARKAVVGPIRSFCERVAKPYHVGGKPDLLALSQAYSLPIIVYK